MSTQQEPNIGRVEMAVHEDGDKRTLTISIRHNVAGEERVTNLAFNWLSSGTDIEAIARVLRILAKDVECQGITVPKEHSEEEGIVTYGMKHRLRKLVNGEWIAEELVGGWFGKKKWKGISYKGTLWGIGESCYDFCIGSKEKALSSLSRRGV